jgi:hypothetical protein
MEGKQILKNAVLWNVKPCDSCSKRATRHHIPEVLTSHMISHPRRFLQEPHDVTSQKTAFFVVTGVNTSNLRQNIVPTGTRTGASWPSNPVGSHCTDCVVLASSHELFDIIRANDVRGSGILGELCLRLSVLRYEGPVTVRDLLKFPEDGSFVFN